jgi:hypothetical protein
VLNSRRMASKEFKPGQHIRIKAIIERTDGVRLQVDFGHDETALIELWQSLRD